jgi:signal transduction histidine kinase
MSLGITEPSHHGREGRRLEAPTRGEIHVPEGRPLLTLRVIKHELRTPINHIIGYSEMLIEDLAGGPDAAALAAMQAILAAGKDMLAVINAQINGDHDPDSIVSPDILASLRSVVARGIDRVSVADVGATSLARSPEFSADVEKILEAAGRLAEFARTGEIPRS